jgi:hypothetical protein
MGIPFCTCVVLCIFFVRDVFLLGSAVEQVRRKLAIYFVTTSFYLVAAISLASSLSSNRAAELLSSAAIWAPALGIHGILWCAAVWLKRRPDRDAMWVIALVPAPMLILAVVAVSHYAAPILGSLDGFHTGLALSAAWLGLVLLGVLGFRALYRGWKDDAFVGDLAVIAGWTGIWILPLSGVVPLG